MASEVKVGSIEAVFRSLQLPVGITIDEVAVIGADAIVSENPFGIELDQPGKVLARLGEKSLSDFLDGQAPGGLRDFRVELVGGFVHIRATAVVLIAVPVQAVCTLRIHEGRQLFADLESVNVLGMGARSMVEAQLEKINPIVDAKDIPLDMEFVRVTVEQGFVELEGRIRPNVLRSE